MKTIPTPPPVTQDELDVWARALKRGAGSHADVARMLRMSPVTWSQWRGRDEHEYEWWWRDVFAACVARLRVMHQSAMAAARQGSTAWVHARYVITTMDKIVERELRPEWFEAITPPSITTPAIGTAVAFLREELGEGAVLARVLRKRAERRGIAPVTLARASERMGVLKRRRGFGKEQVVTWELPPDDD